MPVVYEWDVERQSDSETEQFEEGEVLCHYHQASYADVVMFLRDNQPPAGSRYASVLVRDDDDRRAWAYVDGGLLPAFFHDANGCDYVKVPQRFVKEVSVHGGQEAAA